MAGRRPSRQFMQDFTRTYFAHREDPSYVETLLNGFVNQGMDMDDFYWTQPDMKPTDADLRQILRSPEYGFEESEIEALINQPSTTASR